MENNRDTSAIEELVRLMTLQDERVLAIWAEERRTGFMTHTLNTAIRTQKDLLLSILEVLFDLGLEDCKRHTRWEHTVMVETRRAEEEARGAELIARGKEAIEYLRKQLETPEGREAAERFRKRFSPDVHLDERTSDADSQEAADCSQGDNRGESGAPAAPVAPIPAASILEKLMNLTNLQGQRVLALRAEESKLGFVNPALDGCD
jgi:hypothetical protein